VPCLASVAPRATWLASAAHAKTIKVVANGTTEAIQSAINAASPYDTVIVPAGTYAGPTVKVETSNITLKGSRSAIIDASGNTYGITVGTKLTFDPGTHLPGVQRQQLQDHRPQRAKRR
jgi:polygalacturonase